MKNPFTKTPWDACEALCADGIRLAHEWEELTLKLSKLSREITENRLKAYELAPKKRENESGDLIRKDRTENNLRLHLRRAGLLWAFPAYTSEASQIPSIMESIQEQNRYILSTKE